MDTEQKHPTDAIRVLTADVYVHQGIEEGISMTCSIRFNSELNQDGHAAGIQTLQIAASQYVPDGPPIKAIGLPEELSVDAVLAFLQLRAGQAKNQQAAHFFYVGHDILLAALKSDK